MGRKGPRVDAYIAASAEFARPILLHLRRLVHRACPDVQETIKWGFPHFEYHGVLCSMAAFKKHCAFGFWKASAIRDAAGILRETGSEGMGHLGRITSKDELPSDNVLMGYIKEAAALNEHGVIVKRSARGAKKPLGVPRDRAAALKNTPKARQTFEQFSPSHRREYIDWIVEAKKPETRERRVATTIAWLSAGKRRNWKYER
ncbi:MAG: hypothetical protein C4326_04760 [Ignavibacteria bacterium]|mgnify:CR=1 FL=1